jgi:hypothetical protein
VRQISAATSAEDSQTRDLTELPENAPRYVVLSYELNHSDGRKSFPLVLINWAPTSCEMSLLTLHASGLIEFQNTVRASVAHTKFTAAKLDQADVGKVIEIRDGAEGLTTDYVNSQLQKS